MKKFSKERIEFDKTFKSQVLVGIDEVGWGCIAGDLVLGAVAVSKDDYDKISAEFDQVRDSKKLKPEIRQLIWKSLLNQTTLKFAVGKSSVARINEVGLAKAFNEALESIISQLQAQGVGQGSLFIMDGSRVPEPLKSQNHQLIIKGDDKSFAIGLASILAKETRDEMMVQESKNHPGYGFEDHKGYGTKAHVEALMANGLTPVHRIQSTTKIMSGK